MRGGERVGVGLGDADHGLDAELAAGADDADGDLAAVGDEYPPDVVLGNGDGDGLVWSGLRVGLIRHHDLVVLHRLAVLDQDAVDRARDTGGPC